MSNLTTYTSTSNDEQLISLWLAKRQGGPNTIRSYSYTANKFIEWLRHQPGTLRTLTLDTLVEWRNSLTGNTNTIGQRLAAVKSLLTFGYQIGYLQFNVGQALEKPRVNNKTPRVMTKDEIKNIFRVAKQLGKNELYLVEFLYYTGCRISEALAVNKSSFTKTTDGKAIVLTVIGKGQKKRSFPVPSCLAERFSSWPWGERYARTLVGDIANAAGVEGISPHAFRHTCATHALMNGAPIHVVKDTLGHASLNTTSLYVHALETEGASNYL